MGGSASPGVRVWVHFHLYKGVWVGACPPGGRGLGGWVRRTPPPPGGSQNLGGWVPAETPLPPGCLKKSLVGELLFSLMCDLLWPALFFCEEGV